MREKIETDNIVRIGSEKKIYEYVWPIVIRLQPDPYENYGCLKLRFTKNLKREVIQLCNFFVNLGIEVKEVNKMEEPLRVDRGRFIDNCFEAILIKIGAIRFESKEDYYDRLNQKFEIVK